MPADDLLAERRRKVDELAALGVPAYNVDFHPDHTLASARERLEAWEAGAGAGGAVGDPAAAAAAAPAPAPAAAAGAGAAAEEGPPVLIAGRIKTLRDMGKSYFCHIEDESGTLQVWFKLDRLGEAGFKVVELLDLGDIIGIRGRLMRTRRGEPTVAADELTMLAKSLRPLPEKWHGLQNQETRYRKRYLDLVSSRYARRQFAARTRIVSSIRATLDGRGFLEVETPVLQLVPGGAAATPFTTHWNALHTDVHLRISIELYLKRLLVGGYERVYELGRNFRNEGLSPRHNPEFTMLEVYEAFGDYSTMRELTEAIILNAATAAGPQWVNDDDGERPLNDDPLVRSIEGRELHLHPPFRTARMVDLVAEAVGWDPAERWDSLPAEATKLGIPLPPGTGPGTALLEIYENKVEHTLWDPTFVLDYPEEVSPLARKRKDDPRFVERFELIVAGRELANAFSELNDPIDQRQRFEAQAVRLAAGDAEAQRVDEDFLQAIETGMPPAGGMGMGIDRLAMFLLGVSAIRDVLLFPTMRPEHEAKGTPGAGETARDPGAPDPTEEA